MDFSGIERTITTVLGLIATYYIVLIILSIVPYILKTIATIEIAKRKNLQYKWFAWIPFLRLHLYAQLADRYRVSVGKDSKMRTYAEITLFLLAVCLVAGFKNYLFFLAFIILIPIYSYIDIFTMYYFFMELDNVNAPMYMLLGITNPLLMSIFIFHCRDKGPVAFYRYR